MAARSSRWTTPSGASRAGADAWTSTSTRPRRSSPATESRSRAAAWSTARSRPRTAPRSWAARPGWSRPRCTPAGGARPAGCGSAAATTRSQVANELFGRRLVTRQSPEGKLVYRVYVEEASRHRAGALLRHGRWTAGPRGCMVVGVAPTAAWRSRSSPVAPRDLVRISVEPAVGFLEFQARELAFGLDIPLRAGAAGRARVPQRLPSLPRPGRHHGRDQPAGASPGTASWSRWTPRCPSTTTPCSGSSEIAELRDRSQEDARESHAADRGLAYVGLDGDIGCMINGAGLAMATLDMIKLAGGRRRTSSTSAAALRPERVFKAFRAVLNDENVRAMLVNIFAGINRCDWVAQGVVDAFAAHRRRRSLSWCGWPAPTSRRGASIIAASGLPILTADTLAEAAPSWSSPRRPTQRGVTRDGHPARRPTPRASSRDHRHGSAGSTPRR